MKTKLCKICERVLNVDQFYKNKQGKPLARCKECYKKYNKEHYDYKRSRNYYLESQDHYRKYHREWYENNKEKKLNSCKAYYQKNKDRILENTRKWRQNNKEKTKAHLRVSQALKNGELIKPLKCEFCGGGSLIEAHHHPKHYDTPLNVIWLCRSCHRGYHKGFRKEEIDNLYFKKFFTPAGE